MPHLNVMLRISCWQQKKEGSYYALVDKLTPLRYAPSAKCKFVHRIRVV